MEHHSPDKKYLEYFDYYEDTAVLFDEAAFTQLGEELMLKKTNTLMVIMGGENSSFKSGAHQAFINMTSGFDIETSTFSNVPAEPDVECIRNIVKEMEQVRPDAVAAIGGGSVMDAAKAAYLSWQTGMDVTKLWGVNVASKLFPDSEFDRVICIPTTAGTGSEVTPYANIVDLNTDLKYIIVEDKIVPKLALVDYEFSRSMPRMLTISTALDALTHSMESLLNTKAANAHPLAEEWAMMSVKLVRYALPRILEDPENELCREFLAAAATLGGMCIKTRPTSLPHLCSYSMYRKIPHGIAVSLLLPSCWKYYLEEKNEAVERQTMKLAGIFQCSEKEDTPLDVVKSFEQFLAGILNNATLSDFATFDDAFIQKIAKDSVRNPAKLLSAPRSVSLDSAQDVIASILRKAANI